MGDGTAKANEGLTLAEAAHDALTEIMSSTDNVMKMVDQIAAAVEEQSSTSAEIARNIEQISGASQSAAENSRHVVEATDELIGLSKDLRKMVSAFRLHADGKKGGVRAPGGTFAPGHRQKEEVNEEAFA
jgi:methyl-accepting chemotaxis protein